MSTITIGRVDAKMVGVGLYRTGPLTMHDGQVIEWRFTREGPRRWSVSSLIRGSSGWGMDRDDFYALRDAISYVNDLLPSVENGNHPNGKRVNHGQAIGKMREMAQTTEQNALMLNVSADLLEMHDRTSLSLDNWASAGRMVNRALEMVGEPSFQPNGV